MSHLNTAYNLGVQAALATFEKIAISSEAVANAARNFAQKAEIPLASRAARINELSGNLHHAQGKLKIDRYKIIDNTIKNIKSMNQGRTFNPFSEMIEPEVGQLQPSPIDIGQEWKLTEPVRTNKKLLRNRDLAYKLITPIRHNVLRTLEENKLKEIIQKVQPWRTDIHPSLVR